MRLVIDSDALIKLTKAGAKEVVLNNIKAYIPPSVMNETTGEKEKFPDALKIYENINKGLLKVKKPDRSSFVKSLGIKGGEAEVLMLHDSLSAISSDDGKFLNLLENLNIPYLTPASIIIYLLKKKVIKEEEAKKYLMNLKEMVSDEEYHLAMDEVENDN
jgi:rRNA maturation endonuclease Nob1